MASIDLEVIKLRESRIRLTIRRSSPALIWSGDDGIYIIAANKSRKADRTYRIVDRIACITRGNTTGGQELSQMAVIRGGNLALETSRGSVNVRDVAQTVARAIAESYYSAWTAPIGVEAVLVQLQGTPEEDDMFYVSYKGESVPFEKALFLGSCDINGENHDTETKAHELLQEELEAAWEPDADLHRIAEIFNGLESTRRYPDLTKAFAAKRLETVILDRARLAERNWRTIFNRLT